MRLAGRCSLGLLAWCVGCGALRSQPAPALPPPAAAPSPAPSASVAPGIGTATVPAGDAPTKDDEAELDDGAEEDSEPSDPTIHPLYGLSNQELERRYRTEPKSLGSVSLGTPNAGGLFNGVQMPESALWQLQDPRHAFGTAETVAALLAAIEAVARRFPNTPPLAIGHLSAEHGGHLNPHMSHQSGRDADLGFYYRDGSGWYSRASAERLDAERVWALLEQLGGASQLELVLVDASLHATLRQTAEQSGAKASLIQGLFEGIGARGPVLRHAPGHATHLHLRFRSPEARESARRLAGLAFFRRAVPVVVPERSYKAKPGDTLARIAAQHRTTVDALRRLNGLHGDLVVPGKSYRLPPASTGPKPHAGAAPAAGHPKPRSAPPAATKPATRP